jgi:6-phosphogluconolactonase
MVSAFAIEEADGGLKLLNQVSSKGTAPCHLAVDHAGKWLLVAYYDSGAGRVLNRSGGTGSICGIGSEGQ